MIAQSSLLAATMVLFNVASSAAQEVVCLKCDVFGTEHSYTIVHGRRNGPEIKSTNGSSIYLWDASNRRLSGYDKKRQIILEAEKRIEISDQSITVRIFDQSSSSTTSYYYMIDRVSLVVRSRFEYRSRIDDGMSFEVVTEQQGKCQIIPPQPVQRPRI
jgi:hypothetical protein